MVLQITYSCCRISENLKHAPCHSTVFCFIYELLPYSLVSNGRDSMASLLGPNERDETITICTVDTCVHSVSCFSCPFGSRRSFPIPLHQSDIKLGRSSLFQGSTKNRDQSNAMRERYIPLDLDEIQVQHKRKYRPVTDSIWPSAQVHIYLGV